MVSWDSWNNQNMQVAEGETIQDGIPLSYTTSDTEHQSELILKVFQQIRRWDIFATYSSMQVIARSDSHDVTCLVVSDF